MGGVPDARYDYLPSYLRTSANQVTDWADEDQELPGGNVHLWEAGWDDDDANNDFSKQLKDVLKLMVSNKSAANKPTEKNSKGKEAEDVAMYDLTQLLAPHKANNTLGHTLKKRAKAKRASQKLF